MIYPLPHGTIENRKMAILPILRQQVQIAVKFMEMPDHVCLVFAFSLSS